VGHLTALDGLREAGAGGVVGIPCFCRLWPCQLLPPRVRRSTGRPPCLALRRAVPPCWR